MTQLLLQPASDIDSVRNLDKTIWKNIDVDDYPDYIPSDIATKIKEIVPDGMVSLWGITPSKNGRNEKVWQNIKVGDIALIGGRGAAIGKGTIIAKADLPSLARHVWGKKTTQNPNESTTWQYVYFITEVSVINVRKSIVNELIGHNPNSNWMGVNIIGEEKSSRVIDRLGLSSSKVPEIVSEDEYVDVISATADFSKGTDHQTISMNRKEQAFLRRKCIGVNGPKQCGICSHEYSPEFLVAAHIKKRSLCTHEERIDIDNIVMPLCKFGCDELYERGYFVIDKSGVVSSGRKIQKSQAETYLNAHVGKLCKYYGVDKEKYFEAHRKYHLK
ncbi:hypothetical protein KDX00_03145 [Cobetia amphilecti]|nr:hypothetical protein KDX00_03145 [Cobetia litoralis]